MKIYIAYDGSACAQDILADLPRAGLPAVAEAHILTVADVFLPPSLPSGVARPTDIPLSVRQSWAQAERAVEAARVIAREAQASIQQLFPTWQVEAETCADSPAWGLIKQVDAWQPDLVVVGSHNRSTLGRLMLGSVSQKVLAEARCSVRIARRPRRPGTAPVRLVLGVDGSAGATATVQAVAARQWPHGSEVRLVTSLDGRLTTALAPSSPPIGPWLGSSDVEAHTWVQRMLETHQHTLGAAGLTVSSLIKEGDPKSVLPEEAEQWEADCLVVGAHGLSRVERFLIGSVSMAVAARAPCSVEVIRSQSVG